MLFLFNETAHGVLSIGLRSISAKRVGICPERAREGTGHFIDVFLFILVSG